MALWIALLGPFAVQGDDVHVPDGAEARGLLAMLALSPGHPVSEDRLIGGLLDPGRHAWARRSLQVYASRVQEALGPEADRFERRLGAMCLHAGAGEIDVAWFDDLLDEGTEAALSHALGLWRGRPLDGLTHLPFAALEARRLEHRRALAASELSALRV